MLQQWWIDNEENVRSRKGKEWKTPKKYIGRLGLAIDDKSETEKTMLASSSYLLMSRVNP